MLKFHAILLKDRTMTLLQLVHSSIHFYLAGEQATNAQDKRLDFAGLSARLTKLIHEGSNVGS